MHERERDGDKVTEMYGMCSSVRVSEHVHVSVRVNIFYSSFICVAKTLFQEKKGKEKATIWQHKLLVF